MGAHVVSLFSRDGDQDRDSSSMISVPVLMWRKLVAVLSAYEENICGNSGERFTENACDENNQPDKPNSYISHLSKLVEVEEVGAH